MDAMAHESTVDDLLIKLVIVHSYVKLPEDTCVFVFENHFTRDDEPEQCFINPTCCPEWDWARGNDSLLYLATRLPLKMWLPFGKLT